MPSKKFWSSWASNHVSMYSKEAFFTKGYHRQIYQNYEHPPQRLINCDFQFNPFMAQKFSFSGCSLITWTIIVIITYFSIFRCVTTVALINKTLLSNFYLITYLQPMSLKQDLSPFEGYYSKKLCSKTFILYEYPFSHSENRLYLNT